MPGDRGSGEQPGDHGEDQAEPEPELMSLDRGQGLFKQREQASGTGWNWSSMKQATVALGWVYERPRN